VATSPRCLFALLLDPLFCLSFALKADDDIGNLPRPCYLNADSMVYPDHAICCSGRKRVTIHMHNMVWMRRIANWSRIRSSFKLPHYLHP